MQESGLYGILICSVTVTVNFRIILAEMPLDVVIALKIITDMFIGFLRYGKEKRLYCRYVWRKWL